MKRILRSAAIASIFLLSSATYGQSVCDQFANAIETSLKELAYADVANIGDNSAPRATNNKLAQVAQIELIQANLLLMQANKCSLPRQPLSEKSYRESAIGCAIGNMKATGSDPVAECDRDKWIRK